MAAKLTLLAAAFLVCVSSADLAPADTSLTQQDLETADETQQDLESADEAVLADEAIEGDNSVFGDGGSIAKAMVDILHGMDRDRTPKHKYSKHLREMAKEIMNDTPGASMDQQQLATEILKEGGNVDVSPAPSGESDVEEQKESEEAPVVDAASEDMPEELEAPVIKMASITAHETDAKSTEPKASMPDLMGGILGMGGKHSATRGLEEVLTGLMLAKGGFLATPMGDTVKKVQELVEKEMLPKILEGHTSDQKNLDKMAAEVAKCKTTKDLSVADAEKKKTLYLSVSPTHKTCRVTEASDYTARKSCYEELADKLVVKKLRCNAFADVGDKWADEAKNKAIVTKGAGESQETYIRRVHGTWCKPSALEEYLHHKGLCEKATEEWSDMTKKCTGLDKDFKEQHAKCNNIQKQMDGASCSRAVKMKDACETFAECYNDKKSAYVTTEKMVKGNEKDRQAEWRATKRMQCLIIAFTDGKVTDAEVVACKDKTHSTNHLVINYPKIAAMDACKVPNLYPYTAAYKKAEFAPLPILAKGDPEANDCVGVKEVSTTPAKGSPPTCKCERVTMNGPWSPGALVKCTDCLDVRRTSDKISCPDGTKLFSPRSRNDWATLLTSTAGPIRAPNWIIDVTRPQNGCGGCTSNEMNSENTNQKSWVTADKSPWWLRSSKYSEPNGDYHASCYLDLWHTPKNADSVTWNDGNCNYHAKSYYCQPKLISTTPKAGSPAGCNCVKVEMTGSFSPGVLLKCTSCLDVHKSTQKNSCPMGTKIFSPRSRGDWQTFIESANSLRSPHWIIDVTRPQNGCGGCTGNIMNSGVAAQATWSTADGSAWWLRSSRYNEPNGDYHANCYLDLWQAPANSDSVTWNDGNCNYHSNAYYCQQVK